jgi:hypothetical protein
LRDNGQRRAGTNGVNGQKEYVQIGKSFQNEKIDAAFLEGGSLFAIPFDNLVGRKIAQSGRRRHGADRAGNQDLMGSRISSFAGQSDAAVINCCDFIGQAESRKLRAIGAESIGFDDLGAGLDVCLMYVENGVRLGQVQFFKAALHADRFKKHSTHSAVGYEDVLFQALEEIVSLHPDISTL